MNMSNIKTAGVDTGKKELVVCFLPEGETFTVTNTKTGIAELVRRCLETGRERVAIESTSIYHKACATALAKAGLGLIVAQPGQVKNFAKALLKHGKTDAGDAKILAQYAGFAEPSFDPPDVVLDSLAEHLTYIEQMEEQLALVRTCQERFTNPRLLKSMATRIKRMASEIKAELLRLEKLLRSDLAMARRFDLLISIPGIGMRTALGVLIRMPELGRLSREQAASLAGLAPMPHDSGQHKGERHIYGGRSRLRKTLFMAAFAAATRWNPELVTFYRRLMAKGKAHTKAVIACARKLIILANTILTRKTPWKPKEVMP